jgi:hypothetical protein
VCVTTREDELWRHLAQLGLNADDRDAELPFGKHPTKILESMEHSRWVDSRVCIGIQKHSLETHACVQH